VRRYNSHAERVASPWGVAAAAVAAAGSIYASNKAAGAQRSSANSAIGEQQREYDQTRQDQMPWLQAGQNALGLEQNYLNGDTSGFKNSPDYQFAVQQGTKQLDAGATANGNLWGGGADADRIALGQGLATQYANNYWNKLAGMAGQGQSSAQNLGVMGANSANQIGSQYNNIGYANASSYASNANSLSNLLGQGANIYGQYQQSHSGYAPSSGYIGGNGTGGLGMELQSSNPNSNFGYTPTSF